MAEALGLVLFNIKGRYTSDLIDVEKFHNEDNARLKKALLMAFDPFTNEAIKAVLENQTTMDLTDLEQLR